MRDSGNILEDRDSVAEVFAGETQCTGQSSVEVDASEDGKEGSFVIYQRQRTRFWGHQAMLSVL